MVHTLGDPRHGDGSVVREQLRNVRQVQATDQAFASILEDGSVVGAIRTVVVTPQLSENGSALFEVAAAQLDVGSGQSEPPRYYWSHHCIARIAGRIRFLLA